MLHLSQRLFAQPHIFPEVDKYEYVFTEDSVTGHKVLEQDREAYTIPDSVFTRLDDVLGEVVANVHVGSVSTIDEARQVLRQIEAMLIRLNFACSIPYFLVATFADGLLQRPLDSRLASAPENALRRSNMLAHSTELFSVLDCDLGSLLYLSIAEKFGIPLVMIEVPNHNFVRWRINSNLYLDWDTNFGFDKFTDTQYAADYRVAPEQIVNGVYLADMSKENVMGYFSFVRGLSFQNLQQYPQAIAEYRSSIVAYPQSPEARNNIAWLYVSIPAVQAIITGAEAISMALRACELARTDSYLDTLGCTYAQAGDFASAIRYETEAYNLTHSPDYMASIEAFRQGKTWLDIHGH